MLYPEKHLPTIAVIRRLRAAKADKGSPPLTADGMIELFWSFCENQENVFLMLRTGSVVRVDAAILLRPSGRWFYGTNGMFFHPVQGVIGRYLHSYSGPAWLSCIKGFAGVTLLRQLMSLHWRLITRTMLGAQFMDSVVLFAEADVEKYLAQEKSDVPNPRTEREAARAIVQQYDEGLIRTKGQAKKIIGCEISARGFERAWAAAAATRPHLSRPGRRSLLDL